MQDRSRLIKYLIGTAIFLLTFIIYIKTLCPSVPPRDSGELITAAYTLGIAHPPGYPLYSLLGKLFTLIPFGSIAWRVNLMSAFFASATITITYFFILGLTGSILAAVAAPLILAFAPFFWNLAVIAEVFQLNIFFAALTIYLLWLWKEKKDFRLLLLFTFIYGLSFTNHHTMALLAPGFVYFVWITDKNIYLKLKNWLILGGCFMLGLTPYLYLPIRSLANPYIDWGDPQTLERFINVITRRHFGSLRLDPALPQAAYTWEMITANLKTYFGWLISQFIVVGFLLGILGAVTSFIKQRKIFIYFSLLFLFSGLFFVFMAAYPFHTPHLVLYCSTILRRFMLPGFLIFTFWVGWGIAQLEKWPSIKKYKLVLIILITMLPLASLTMHYKKVDMSKYYYVEDLVKNIFNSAKPNSIIFANSDTSLFSMWYMQGVEGLRADITIISSTPQIWRAERLMQKSPQLVGLPDNPTKDQIAEKIASYPSGLHFYQDLIMRNAKDIDIYSDLDDSKAFGQLFNLLAPNALLFKFMPTTSMSAKSNNLEKTYSLWNKYQFRSALSSANMQDYTTREILTFYAEGHNFSGMIYAENKQYDKAGNEFMKALKIYPNYPSARINLKKLRGILQNN
jgi:tetratricopeptide (TPR) repeat protein